MSDPPPTPPGLLHDSSLPQSPLIVATDDGTESSGPPSSINLNQTQMTQLDPGQLAPISQVDPRILEYLASKLRNQMPSGSGQVEGQAAPINMEDVAATFRNILVDSKAEDLHNFMNTMVVNSQGSDQPGPSNRANATSNLLTLLGKPLTIPGPSEPSKELPGPSEPSKDLPGPSEPSEDLPEPSEPSKELPGPSEPSKPSPGPSTQPIASNKVSESSTSGVSKANQLEPSTVETKSEFPGSSEPSKASVSSIQLQIASDRSSGPSTSSIAKMDQSEPPTAQISASSQPPNASTDGSKSSQKLRATKDLSRTSARPKAKRSTKKSRSPGQPSSDKLQSLAKMDQPEPSSSSGQSNPVNLSATQPKDSRPSVTSFTEYKRCYPCKAKQKLEEPGPSEQLEEQGPKPKKRKMVETEYMVDRIIDCRCVRGVLSLRTYWEGPYKAEWVRMECFVDWKENDPVFVYIINNFEKFRKCYRQWKNKPTEDISESEFEWDWTKDMGKRRRSLKQVKRPINEEWIWSESDYPIPDCRFTRNDRWWKKSGIQDSGEAEDMEESSGAQQEGINDLDQQMCQINEAVRLAISNHGRLSSKDRWEPVAELVRKDFPIHLPLFNGEFLVDFVAQNGSMPLLNLLLDRGAFPTTQLSTPIESIVEEHMDKVATAIEKTISDLYPNLNIGNDKEDFKSMLKSFVSIPVGTMGHVKKEVNVQLREGQKFGLLVTPMIFKEVGFEIARDAEFELFFNEQRLQPKFANFFEATPLQGPNRLELDFPRAAKNFLVVVPVWFTETA
ncbi:unnamed protein product [Caenorhabditis nigoni]